MDQPLVGENLQDHLEFYVQYLMLCWICWGILSAELRSQPFFFEKSRTFVKSGLLKTLQQFALKTNDNFGFFFGMMHRPDTSIRGAWNAGDDSECYNPTMKTPSNHSN